MKRLICFWLLTLIFWVITFVDLGSVNELFSPDTNSYFEFSEFRQPLYGLWMKYGYIMTGNWATLKMLQVTLFCCAMTFLIYELYSVSFIGVISGTLFAFLIMIFNHYGMVSYVASLISEGLFYSFLVLQMALVIRWLRTGRIVYAISAIVVCVFITQLKTAYLPAIALICLMILASVFYKFRSAKSGSSGALWKCICCFLLCLAVVPMIVGKSFFQITTEKNRMGFVIMPRISQLPTPPNIMQLVPAWEPMAKTWREAAESLSAAEFSQFDAQLQEAVRYHLYPVVLMTEMEGIDEKRARTQWGSGRKYDDAYFLTIDWIKHSPEEYSIQSLKHLWGMLGLSGLMINSERKNIWNALNSLSIETWNKAPFRKDYPLNNMDQSVSIFTEMFYSILRILAVFILLLASWSIVFIIKAIYRGAPLKKSQLIMSLTIMLTILISLPAALMVFPEIRYIYANVLIMFSGFAAWAAFEGRNHTLSTNQDAT